MNWRWIIGCLLVAMMGGAAGVIFEQDPPTQSQRPQLARELPPAPSLGSSDEASAGSTRRANGEAFAGRAEAGKDEPVLRQEGIAAYYADKYQGRKTASGESFDQAEL